MNVNKKSALWRVVDRMLALTFICILIIGCIFAVIGWKKARCAMSGSATGYKTKWEPIVGCLVQQPSGHWLPIENMRGTP